MRTVEDQVKRLFIGTDACDWDSVLSIFCEKVELDYQSMTGQPAEILDNSHIVENWKSILPGFDHTHHQIGNIIITQHEKEALAFCYGTATHFIANGQGGELWTVVGTYEFKLQQSNTQWCINKMKFNFKYQTGNCDLPTRAMLNIKNQK